MGCSNITLPLPLLHISNHGGGGGGGAGEETNILIKPTIPSYKWRLVISYDGTKFSGWQYQETVPTVQCNIEKALMRSTKLERKDLCLVGASRTDAGVHAWGQVAQFLTPFNYESLDSIHAAVNGLLPSDIRVREISPALPEFHARFFPKSKIYHYKIYNDAVMDPLQRHFAYHYTYKLNVVAMREAANHFVGTHDFSAFANASNRDGVANPVKHIFRFDVIEMGPLLQLEVEGSGFLYRQVRNMVALLLHVGREAIPPEIVLKIMATRDRRELAKYALSTPPHGLSLMSVLYNEELLKPPPDSPPTSFGRYHTITHCKLPFY
ncbi:uncharacterized protein LOC113333022 isoform X2 [Papaver somniferum]|uniref:uncharacterized protein LOC113333022 isoform X2 n=1 Tax=Papaver somniferum TaxID=3469 RepID=UPI000E6FA99D|nr:uncharacterized protein LOC113333022 isoform X2 [Papaver somniferum]